MNRTILTLGGSILVLVLTASLASAVRNPPKKAGKFQASIIQGVETCASGTENTATAGGLLVLPACQPAVPSDPGCVFSEKGSGKLSAKGKDDIAIQMKLNGIDSACNGQALCARTSFRATTDACAAGADCTTLDQIDFPLFACCVVSKGKCQVKTTVNTSIPGAIVSGNNLEIEILGCDVLRGTEPESAFRCGVMVP